MIDGNLIYEKIIFPGTVVDDQDPFMLGRIRASGTTDDIQSLLAAIPGSNPETGEVPADIKWTPKDPLLFLPLLPYFVSQVPKVGENIQIIYQNPRVQYQNQFYIQGPFSTPLLTPFENTVSAQKWLGVGIQFKNFKPIKNPDGTYADKNSIGVFPEPGDNALLGRGSADVVVKKDEVILRAGKTRYMNPLELPVAYNKRSFLQLSQFQQTRKDLGLSKVTKLNQIVQSVKFLIEYTLFNPENQSNMFRGQIYVYQFDGTILTNDEFSLTKNYQQYTTLLDTIDFGPVNMDTVVTTINDVLRGYNNNESTPVFFKPTLEMVKYLKSTDRNFRIQKMNVQAMYTYVKPEVSTKLNGSGLIFFKNAYGQQYKPEKIIKEVVDWSMTPQSISTLGGDIVYLLSHQSQIPGKKIVDLDGTLYGIPQEKFIDDIFNSTNSMVRGEELLKLIGAIVKYLVSHTHQYHLIPPGPIARNGSSREDIEQLMQQASQKILNNNIRIN